MSSRVACANVRAPAPGLDLDAARVRELGGRARRDHLAARDDRHAVAHQLDLGQQVRVQQHRDAARAQRLQQLAHRPPPGRVERARRLVEQQQPRVADHRLRDPEPLLHALRHRADAPVATSPSADQLEQLAPLARAAARASRASGAAPAARPRSASPGSGTARPGSRSRRRARTLPARRPHQPARDLHQRRLPGAVRARAARPARPRRRQVDALERLVRAVPLAQFIEQ